MFSLDLVTASFIYALITIISTIVITFLLWQYKTRYNGVYKIIYCFVFQIIALVLILFRKNIPFFISFDLANLISIIGVLSFYLGIEAYTEKKSSLIPNLVLFVIFSFLQLYFILWNPNSTMRWVSVSLLWLIIFSESTWLLLFRVSKSKFRLTIPVSIICLCFCLLCLVKVFKVIHGIYSQEGFLYTTQFDVIAITILVLLVVMLTYSLENMFSRQLHIDLKAGEEKFSKAFKTSPYGLIITRISDAIIIEINQGFQNISGYTFNDLLGKTARVDIFWVNPEDRKFISRELSLNGKIYGLELNLRKKSGEIITCLLSSEKIHIDKEECILTSIQDITQRKEYELELISSKEKAEESDRLKTAFLQNISHEIRTPMNAIIGFSSLLGEPDLTVENRDLYIDLMTSSSNHLLTIVNDIIEISNIEAGFARLREEAVNLNSIITSTALRYRFRADKKGINIEVKKGLSDHDSVIHADKTKLVQILTNLLDNALKFSDTGEISFGYQLKNNFLEFFVSDKGIGIPYDKQEKIFERFYQVEYSSSRPYEGTGLGLSITKAFIEMAGGKIWVESEPGKGTTFFFTLPYMKNNQLHNIPEPV